MRLSDLKEAVSPANQGVAMSKIVSYLEKQLGKKMTKLTTEKFKNSSDSGIGVRYVFDGSVLCVRFNWAQGKSSEVVSVDVWTGSGRDPNFHITWKGQSLAKSLPALARAIATPKIGTMAGAKEEALAEAKKGEFTERSAINDMIDKLEQGRSFNRSEFIMNYHPENAHAYDDWVEKNKDQLVTSGKRISLAKGAKVQTASPADSGSGSVTVAKGGKSEEYDVDVPNAEDDRVSYNDSLEHLEGLTQGLIKGSFNALFVAGKGGCLFGDTRLRIRFED